MADNIQLERDTKNGENGLQIYCMRLGERFNRRWQ